MDLEDNGDAHLGLAPGDGAFLGPEEEEEALSEEEEEALSEEEEASHFEDLLLQLAGEANTKNAVRLVFTDLILNQLQCSQAKGSMVLRAIRLMKSISPEWESQLTETYPTMHKAVKRRIEKGERTKYASVEATGGEVSPAPLLLLLASSTSSPTNLQNNRLFGEIEESYPLDIMHTLGLQLVSGDSHNSLL